VKQKQSEEAKRRSEAKKRSEEAKRRSEAKQSSRNVPKFVKHKPLRACVSLTKGSGHKMAIY
jgi:hypothetical protein